MNETITERPICLPDAILRRALEETVGPEQTALALQRAGQSSGDILFEHLHEDSTTGTLAELGEVFWGERLYTHFVEEGWGGMHFEEIHKGLGSLTSPDWLEADPNEGAPRPSCHFTTGLLANLFGRIAEVEIGVLEVECRSKGDLHCRFLFGGRNALENLYAEIRAGATLEAAIESLG